LKFGNVDELTGEKGMKRNDALRLLQAHKAELVKRYGVVELALFGSTARDTAGPESDIDVLVAFDGPASSKRFFGVQFYLEDLLGAPVDLVTDKALRPELRPYVTRESVHV
jgi:predicted nucleotidyltransferase